MTGPVFQPPTVPQSLEVQLASLPNAVPFARRLAREWFRGWGLTEHVITSAELITSELVTNAVTNAKTPSLRLRIRWAGQSGHIEVWDADPNPPVKAEPDETNPHGRGLVLIEAYAVCWDYYASVGGKVVWAELSLGHMAS